MRSILALLVCCIGSIAMAENPLPLTRAHSHNDYFQKRPLAEALDNGFCSVEADTHLVDGELLVAHDLERVRPEGTLQAMYLDPLLARVRAYGGAVYPGGPGGFILLIDFKGKGEESYARLRTLLEGYEEMLTVFTPASTQQKAVTVILSGARPGDTVAAEPRRFVGLDGRPGDLERGVNPHLFPLVSDSWTSQFAWKGAGPMPEAEQARLKELVARTHAQGAKLRFWGLPRPSVLWPVLYDAGVDLLNADNLPALRALLLEKQGASATP